MLRTASVHKAIRSPWTFVSACRATTQSRCLSNLHRPGKYLEGCPGSCFTSFDFDLVWVFDDFWYLDNLWKVVIKATACRISKILFSTNLAQHETLAHSMAQSLQKLHESAKVVVARRASYHGNQVHWMSSCYLLGSLYTPKNSFWS